MCGHKNLLRSVLVAAELPGSRPATKDGYDLGCAVGTRPRCVEPRPDAARPAESVTPIDGYRDL